MSTVFETRIAVEHDVSVQHDVSLVGEFAPDRRVAHAVPEPAAADDGDWYEWLAFGGPLDPAGTVFAFALSVAATVGLVVLVAAVVRVVSGG